MYSTLTLVAKERLDNRKGPKYRHEKMKVKRSSDAYVGKISQRVNSTKFAYDDEEEEEEEKKDVGRSGGGKRVRSDIEVESNELIVEMNVQQKPKAVKKSKRTVFSD